MRDLDGRVALVTGGGSGIGRGIALTLAGEGMRVVLADIEPDAAKVVAAEIAASGGEASAEALDVTDPAAVEALADRRYAQHGGVDVLCNNAGVGGPTPLGPESLNNWRWIIDVNLLGVAHVINAFVRLMRASAEAEASAASDRAAAGNRLGPLDGIPVAVKDLFDTAGVVTNAGTSAFLDRVPARDATAVARLRDAGAVASRRSHSPSTTPVRSPGPPRTARCC